MADSLDNPAPAATGEGTSRPIIAGTTHQCGPYEGPPWEISFRRTASTTEAFRPCVWSL